MFISFLELRKQKQLNYFIHYFQVLLRVGLCSLLRWFWLSVLVLLFGYRLVLVIFFVCFFLFVFFTSYPSSLLLSPLSPNHTPFSFFFLLFFTHLPLSSFLLPSSSSTPFIPHLFSSSFSFSSYFIFLFYPLFLFFQTVIPISNICVLFFLQKQDMWKNKEQFPRGFPQGPFEGFWWAYVSMTTVG